MEELKVKNEGLPLIAHVILAVQEGQLVHCGLQWD